MLTIADRLSYPPGRRQARDVLAGHHARRPALRPRPRGEPAADHAPAPARAGRLGAHPRRGVRPQPLGAEASAGPERGRQLSPGAGYRGLIRGGTSSVGLAAAALAAWRGATVLSTTRRAGRLAFLKERGVDHPLLDTGE